MIRLDNIREIATTKNIALTFIDASGITAYIKGDVLPIFVRIVNTNPTLDNVNQRLEIVESRLGI